MGRWTDILLVFTLVPAWGLAIVDDGPAAPLVPGPVRFEENRGQIPSHHSFRVRTGSYQAYLAPRHVDFVLPTARPSCEAGAPPFRRVRMNFVESNSGTLAGLDQLNNDARESSEFDARHGLFPASRAVPIGTPGSEPESPAISSVFIPGLMLTVRRIDTISGLCSKSS